MFCGGTYKRILEHIAKPAREGALIKYDTIVTNIQSSGEEGGPLTVSTRDGASFEFDEVVFTAPLGWLKRHPEAFSPPLPPRLTKAIESIGYGCLEKVSFDRQGLICHFFRPSYPFLFSLGFVASYL